MGCTLSYHTHTHTHTKSYTYYLFLQFENTHKGVSFEACRNLELSRISKDSAKKKKKNLGFPRKEWFKGSNNVFVILNPFF